MNRIVSTDTLFHFTSSIENLESILKNEFYPQFCFEDFFGTILDRPELEKAIPMVCFCDIPLSQIGRYIHTYGEYGIGMSKKWAIKNKVNPVLYTYPNSDVSNKLKEMIFIMANLYKNNDTPTDKLKKECFSVLQYLKPYEARLWKNGKWTSEKVRFYDEREWRYVLRQPGVDEPIMVTRSDCEKGQPKDLSGFNNIIIESAVFRLSFEPKDIKYIIVKNENEILSMHNKITNIKGGKFSYNDVNILTTRIISMESIKENF